MAKKKHHEEHENLERWLVSYADFITLLFAFFTVLYALGQTDKAKYKQAVDSIQKAFRSSGGVFSGGIFPLKGTPFVPFDKAPDQGSKTPPTALDMGKFSKAEAQTLAKIAEQVRGLFEATTGFSARPDEVDVIRSTEGFKIRIAEAMLFNASSTKLKRKESAFLFEMAKKMSTLNLKIQIEGHTDNKESGRQLTSIDEATDFKLSVDRAYSMMRFFVEGADFPKENISIAGYGDTHPIASNESPEGRAKNRRVEISLITPDHEVHELEL